MKNKVFLFTVLISIFFLNGCAWLSEGVVNIFDPKAQIRVSSYTITPSTGDVPATITIDLESLNAVGARFGTFVYEYAKNIGAGTPITIPELSRTYGVTLLLPPGSETTGGTLSINDIPLYFQDEIDYLKVHPEITELLLTLWLKGSDESDHKIELEILRDYPISVMPITVSTLNIMANPTVVSPGGTSTITVQALDTNGKPISNAVITLSSDDGAFASTSLTTDATGYATTTFTAGSTIGDIAINAISGTATAGTTVTVKSGQAATLTITANPVTVLVGGTSIVTIRVLDTNGKPVKDATVTLTATGGSISQPSATDESGYATTTLDTTGVTSGTTITITGVSGGAVGTATVNVQ